LMSEVDENGSDWIHSRTCWVAMTSFCVSTDFEDGVGYGFGEGSLIKESNSTRGPGIQ
jgi:hypothetical protein